MGIRISSVVALAAFCLGWGAQPGQAKTLLLLPVQGETDKTQDLAAVDELYKEAVRNAYQGDVKTPTDSAHQCGDRDCAGKLAQASKADEVMFTNMRRLGGKWIFSSTIMRADGGDLFNQRGTALNLEDLEAVTRRVGEAVVARLSTEKAASIDNITEKEETMEPTRRRSLYAGGLSLGYLYPVGHSYAYLEEKGFPATLREKQYRQMVKMTWLNTWEFRDNFILGFDVVWPIPHVIGADLNFQYLLTRTDFSPFVGGGVGIYYSAPDDTSTTDKFNSGPALNVQAGMILFRTYDIHVQARAQYHLVFTSDKEHGPAFDVGVVYQRKEKERGGSGWGAFWKYYLLGVIFLSVVGSVAGND